MRIAALILGMVGAGMAAGSAMASQPPRSYAISPLVKQSTVTLLGGKSLTLKTLAANPGAHVTFQDLVPGANWAHPAVVQVISKDGQVLESRPVRLPPLHLDQVAATSGHARPDGQPQFNIKDFGGKYKVANPEHFFALLINGSADQRHYNDFSFLYRVLTKVYGYSPKNIFIADSAYVGTAADVDGDGTPDIQYQSTVQGVTDLFTKLKGTLTPQDQLLIATDDHGDTQDGESTLYLYDGEMKASVFAGLQNALPAGRVMAIHEPCYSGGLVRPTIQPNRMAMAAATNVELSWASTDENFDEFIYHVIAAFGMQTYNGQAVQSDLNGDGKISAREAFAYAIAHDQRQESPVAEDEPDSGFASQIGMGF